MKIEQTLRPNKLKDFVGKEQIKNNLKIFIQSAKNRNNCIDHILIHGIAGTGKTTLANIIANEFDRKIKVIQGTQLKKISDLINYISMISYGDFIFIDEIHAASIECIETLYSVLEDFVIDIKIGTENNQKISRVKIPNFTLIAATTNIDKISKPLEERFGINFYFDLYNTEEIFLILKRSAQIYNIDINEDELYQIAENSKGVPRIANNYLKRVLDFKNNEQAMSIKDILIHLGIFNDGLLKMDLKYLMALDDNEGLGIKSISSILGLETSIIENKIEPFLLRNHYIRKTNKGRILTKKGNDYLEQIYKDYKPNEL